MIGIEDVIILYLQKEISYLRSKPLITQRSYLPPTDLRLGVSAHRTEEEEVKLFSKKIPQIEGDAGRDGDTFVDDVVDLSEIFSILSWLLVLLWS
jgi:hypothetical protein